MKRELKGFEEVARVLVEALPESHEERIESSTTHAPTASTGLGGIS